MADASDGIVRGIFAQGIAPSTINLSVVSTHHVRQAIRLIDLRAGGTFRQQLAEAQASHNPFARYVSHNANPRPLARLLRAVYTHWSAICVQEAPYYDSEFWDSHSGHYNARFLQPPRFCERFHFLSPKRPELASIDAAALLTALQHPSRLEDDWDYLGYAVLRPTLSSCVGRTALVFDTAVRQDTPLQWTRDALEEGGTACLTMAHRCVANLLGKRFKFNSVEFMQQDPNLGACATVSLWVATHVARERFDLNTFNYTTITRQALAPAIGFRTDFPNLEPDVPKAGLTRVEMMNAIAATGARPLMYAPGYDLATDRLLHEVHSFVTSGVPAILLLEGSPIDAEHVESTDLDDSHAVVIVGHSAPGFEAVRAHRDRFAATRGDRHLPLSAIAPVYYAHDDRSGPFRRVVFDYSPNGLMAIIDKEVRRVASAIVPVHLTITCGASTSLEYAQGVLDQPVFRTFLDSLIGFDERSLLWRAVLTEGASFKSSVIARHFAPDLVRWYGTLMLPKHVWLLEYSAVQLPDGWADYVSGPNDRPISGEFLMDSSAPQEEPRCLAFRIGTVGFDYRAAPNDREPAVRSADLAGWQRYLSFPQRDGQQGLG